MKSLKCTAVASTILMSTMAGPVTADLLGPTNPTIRNGLCVGNDCQDSEILGPAELLLKANRPRITFEDSSVGDFPTNDWAIRANNNNQNQPEEFAIEDLGPTGAGSADILVLRAGAPEHSLFVSDSGDVGLGTNAPARELHIVAQSTPRIQLEHGTVTPYSWDIAANDSNFFINDVTADTVPLVIEDGAPDFSFNVESNGDVGIGTAGPDGKLHTRGDGTQLVYFESANGGAVQVRFRSNSQNRRFLAVDNDNNVQTQMQFRDDEILFLGASAADQWLSVSAAGITTMGGTCNVNPCDRTFDPEYFTVPTIEERAAYMWENMHLPAVGPTKAGAPINLTEKTTGMLHELEVAHIYIEQLHDALQNSKDAQAEMQTQLEQVLSRLDALETQ